MSVDEVMKELEAMGSASIRKVHASHGAREPFFGVKVGDMKTLIKRIKKDQALAEALFKTGNSDAMYMAGLINDDKAMTPELLDAWADAAYWYMISEYTVAWVAAEGLYGWQMALKWIESPKENVACTGWSTLSHLVALKSDDALDLEALRGLLKRVEQTVHQQPNRVRYTMNGFVISVGCYVTALTPLAYEVGAKIGKVHVEMGGTDCKVPDVVDYIRKVEDMGRIGKKKKTVKC